MLRIFKAQFIRDFADRLIRIENSFLGHQRGLTPAQIALAWLMAQKPRVVPIPGTTKLAHLQENLWSAYITFTPDELNRLTTTIEEIKIVGARYLAPVKK